jgi:hypothetical protein
MVQLASHDSAMTNSTAQDNVYKVYVDPEKLMHSLDTGVTTHFREWWTAPVLGGTHTRDASPVKKGFPPVEVVTNEELTRFEYGDDQNGKEWTKSRDAWLRVRSFIWPCSSVTLRFSWVLIPLFMCLCVCLG